MDEQNTLYPRILYLGEVSDDELDDSVDANEDEKTQLMIFEVIEEYGDRIISKVHESTKAYLWGILPKPISGSPSSICKVMAMIPTRHPEYWQSLCSYHPCVDLR